MNLEESTAIQRVGCAYCQQPPREICLFSDGVPIEDGVHEERLEALRLAVKPFCPCDTGMPQDCQPEDWPGAH